MHLLHFVIVTKNKIQKQKSSEKKMFSVAVTVSVIKSKNMVGTVRIFIILSQVNKKEGGRGIFLNPTESIMGYIMTKIMICVLL